MKYGIAAACIAATSCRASCACCSVDCTAAACAASFAAVVAVAFALLLLPRLPSPLPPLPLSFFPAPLLPPPLLLAAAASPPLPSRFPSGSTLQLLVIACDGLTEAWSPLWCPAPTLWPSLSWLLPLALVPFGPGPGSLGSSVNPSCFDLWQAVSTFFCGLLLSC